MGAKKKYQRYQSSLSKGSAYISKNKKPNSCKIDFQREKAKAIAATNGFIQIIMQRSWPESSKAYAMGEAMLNCSLRLCELSFLTKSSKHNKTELLRDAFSVYFELQASLNHKRFHKWLALARNSRLRRSDFFMPDNWPNPLAERYNNFLEASLTFASEIADLAKRAFSMVETDSILIWIDDSLSHLRESLSSRYVTLDGIASESFGKDYFLQLHKEWGWATRQLKHAGQKSKPASDNSSRKSPQKNPFRFGHGQAFFNNKDLELPTGAAVEILQKLAQSLGQAVKHRDLDLQSTDSNASESLRGRITVIRTTLKKNKTCYRIRPVRGIGYILEQN